MAVSVRRPRRRGNKAAFSRERMERRKAGYADGYQEGVQAGREGYAAGFEGTSIVIPTYNQLGLLKMCIRSIRAHTGSPFEIIVIDNASTDGTSGYLRRLGRAVRHCVLPFNRGFAGAVNAGLMMARGSTIVLLNNDTLVTERWLENMLACLHSDEGIGMVGPVTNFIGGDQQIPVPYRRVRDLPAFAARHNTPDPSRWRETDRLVGFCLLLRRELFRQVGYFDEGFELGNFEDDDYDVRVRLLGKRLAVAGDAFIHHFGSVSMNALGDLRAQVNERNERYYSAKWGSPHDWILRVGRLRAADGELLATASAASSSASASGMAALYPVRLFVQGVGETVYWIGGDSVRRPVVGETALPTVRVTQIDLLRWPAGEPIGAAEAEALWRETADADGRPVGMARLPDGTAYWLGGDGGARRVISEAALVSWRVQEKPIRLAQPEELAGLAEGLPIVPLPVMRQRL